VATERPFDFLVLDPARDTAHARPPPGDAWRADPSDRAGFAASRVRRPGKSKAWWWSGLALAAFGGMALGAWQLQGRPLDVAEMLRSGLAAPGIEPASATVSDPAAAAAVPATPAVKPVRPAEPVLPSTQKPPTAAGVPTPAPLPVSAATPRQECGSRTQFALYRCMQLQCEQSRWNRHPQCLQFAVTDSVE
jgi:hypothetical protein